MFFVVFFLALLLILQIKKYKLYNSSILLLNWFIFNSFFSPAVYYSVLEGEDYKFFTETDYTIFLQIGTYFLLLTLILNFILIKCKNPPRIKFKHIKIKGTAKVFTVLTFLLVSGYVFVFYEKLPLTSLLIQGVLFNPLERPDVAGGLPMYFTVQAFFTTVLPLLYIYWKEKSNWNTGKNFYYSTIVFFFMVVGGNKGMLVYFFIFLWWYFWNFKLDRRIILCIMVALLFFHVIFLGRVITDMGMIGLIYSPVRRFFVTQGAMFINRVGFINSGIDISTKATTISRFIFVNVYGDDGGSAACFFAGDLLVGFGMINGLIISTLVLVVFYLVAKEVDIVKTNNLHILWVYYVCSFLIGNGSIGDSFIFRLILLLLSLYIINYEPAGNLKTEKAIN